MPFLAPIIAAVATLVAPVVSTIGAAFTATAGFIQGGLTAIGLGGSIITGTAVLKGALLVGIMFIAQSLNSPKKATSSAVDQGQELQLKLDPTMPRQVCLGDTATGGSLVWSYTYTDDDTKPNRYLVRIIEISDWMISGINQVWDSSANAAVTWGSADIFSDMQPLDQYRDASSNPCAYMQIFKGSLTATASAWLIANTSGQWTTNHKGTGIAYAVIRYDYNTVAFPNGEPSLQFFVQGAPCYDQRFDGSFGDGRTGSQRLDDPTTWVGTNNTAVVAQQVLRGFWINNVLICGSQAETKDLADTMLVAAYNTCDETETNADATTEARYRVGYMLTADTNLDQQLSDLELAMGGNIYDRAGAITLIPGGAQTPALALTDDDIDWTAARSWQPKGQLNSMYNYLSGTFIDDQQEYTQQPFAPRYNGDWETDDGGQRLVKTVNFNSVTHRTQVERITASLHALSRFSGLVTITCPIWAFQLEQGDWFTLTTSRWDMSAKTFVCLSTTLTTALQYVIIGEEIDASAYDYDAIVQERPNSGSFYQSPGFSLPVPALTVSTTTVENADSTFLIPAIQIVCNNISAGSNATQVDYQLAYFIGSTLTNAADIGTYSASETSIIWSQSIMPNYEYAVRARASNGLAFGEWSTWFTTTAGTTYTVPGAGTIGGKTADEWQAEIDDIDVQGNTIHDRVLQNISDLWTLSTGVMDLMLSAAADRSYVEDLTYLRGQPVGTVIDANQTAQVDGDTAIVTTLALLGAKSGDGLSWILDLDTVLASPTETMAQRFSQLDSTDGTNAADISTLSTSTTTQFTAVASLISLLGAQNGGHTAFILNQSTVQIDPTTSLASYISGVTSSFGTTNAAISTEVTARSAGDTSLASLITSLTGTVGSNTTSITSLTTVTNGILGRWGISIDSNGHVAGIELLDGTSGTSSFVISADSLAFVDTSGGSLQSPFYISGGIVYADSLVVQNLRANSITTPNMQGSTVTVTSYSADGSAVTLDNSGESTMISSSFDCDDNDEDVFILFNVVVNDTSTSQNPTITTRLYIDSSLANSYFDVAHQASTSSYTHSWTALTPGTGTHSFWLTGKSNLSLGTQVQKAFADFTTTRFKR